MARRKDKGKKDGGKFKYRKRDAKSVEKRGNSGGGDKDFMFVEDTPFFKVNDGDNLIRPLPPTWDNAEHYGMDIWVHYGIGPDNSTYLCPQKMLNKPCPICEERAANSGDEEYAKELKPKNRVLVYLIDRDNEDKGPQAWAMPWGLDKDICKLSVDKRSGEVLYLDDPEDGYDIEFEKNGTGMKTKYEAPAIARKSSDLGEDEWLDYVDANSLPDILNFFDYDHIAAVFNGGGGGSEEEEEQEEKPSKRDRKSKKDKEEEEAEDPAYTLEDIEDMSRRKLDKLADELEIDEDDVDDMDDDELREAVCDELDIQMEDPEEEEDEEEEEKPSKRDRKSSRRKKDEEEEDEEEEEKPRKKSKLQELKDKRKKKNQ